MMVLENSAMESLDLRAMLETSLAIAEELELTGIGQRMIASAIENAGAQRGVLIRQDDQEIVVVGEQRAGGLFTAHALPLDHFETLPRSIVRQVARSSEPVVISDASSDRRTVDDLYLRTSGTLSLFALPVIRNGKAVAVLYLENHLVRGAFTKDRIEILQLLSRQMATSLENAQRFAELNQVNRTLEQQVAEHAQELETAQKELIDLANQANKAQIATDVLHNVGNILSSLNTAVGLFRERIRNSCTTGISKMAALMSKHRDDLGEFIARDPRGKKLPEYVERLAEQTDKERALYEQSVADLSKHIEHINAIISLQQSHARTAGLVQQTSLSEAIADAICINEAGFARHAAEVETQFDELPPIRTDRHKVLQILVNLLSNAKYAVSASETPDKRIWVRLYQIDAQRVRIEVEDNGVGIDPENIAKVFTYGFTTKPEGHGFGLHSSANAAKQIGATLAAHSPGVEQGATFSLELPVQPVTHHTMPELAMKGPSDRG
jgi:signal transduction histidine kinase